MKGVIPDESDDLPFLQANSVKPSNGDSFFIRNIREEKGLSQRELAQRLGISRSTLVHLERKSFSCITLGQLDFISKALEIKFEDLVLRANGSKNSNPNRSSLTAPFFTLDLSKGIRIASQLRKPRNAFIGTIALAPHCTLEPQNVPRADLVFFLVQQGILVIKNCLKEYIVKEGESLSFVHSENYELYNPNQLKETVALLFTLPSFIIAKS